MRILLDIDSYGRLIRICCPAQTSAEGDWASADALTFGKNLQHPGGLRQASSLLRLSKIQIKLAISSAVLVNVVFDSYFPRCICTTHITDFPENRPLRSPGSIVAAEDPEDSAIRIWVAAVQGVFVI